MLIVVVIIAVVAAIAIPNLLASRLASNETAAISTLRMLISAQAQFQTRGLADEDVDGVGEYGTLAEMSAGVSVRGTLETIQPPVLSTAFRSVNASGEVGRSGYLFRMYLPDANGDGLGEIGGGGAPAGLDTDLCETTWCAYAWPSNVQSSGTRTFFVNQAGDIIAATNLNHSGPGNAPDPGAALRTPGGVDSITGILTTAMTGRDGMFWNQVGN